MAIPKFKEWGYTVTIVKPTETYEYFFEHKITRGSNKGKCYGFPMPMGCHLNTVKTEALKKEQRKYKNPLTIVGIASDEPKRYVSTKQKGNRSLLWDYKMTEQEAKELCKQYGLLSPIYEYTKRDGCFFCPNAKSHELERLYTNYPALWKRWIEITNREDIVNKQFNGLKRLSLQSYDKQFYLLSGRAYRDALGDRGYMGGK